MHPELCEPEPKSNGAQREKPRGSQRYRPGHAAIISASLSVLALVAGAGVTTPARIARTPAYIEVHSGIPLAWLVSKEPHPQLTRLGSMATRRFLPLSALASVSILFVMFFVPQMIGIWLLSRAWVNPRNCMKCGYDLTGLPSAVCPECGSRFHPSDPPDRSIEGGQGSPLE